MNREKQCTSCGEVKPFSDFWIKRASKDGRETICIECKMKKKAGKKCI